MNAPSELLAATEENQTTIRMWVAMGLVVEWTRPSENGWFPSFLKNQDPNFRFSRFTIYRIKPEE